MKPTNRNRAYCLGGATEAREPSPLTTLVVATFANGR
jgi:hypothetical protein